MADLSKIKQLKIHKMQAAESALQKSVDELQKALRALETAKQEKLAYSIWRTNQELEIYKQIDNQILKMKQLDELRNRISTLYEKESELSQQVLERETQASAAKAYHQKCQKALREAQKDVEKYEILTTEISLVAQKEAERQSEDVLDEFSSYVTEKNRHADATA
ncbi:hypothetical protein TDB9533_04605 [Thalassocella blandensis]|nr:hypothetical protein TDB9533_04605 [Thalassocella blandensis]